MRRACAGWRMLPSYPFHFIESSLPSATVCVQSLPHLHFQWQFRDSLRLRARSLFLSSRFPLMAAVLESLPVPRAAASGVRSQLSSTLAPPSAVAIGRRRAAASLPEFKGLKVQSRNPRRTLASGRRPERISRGGSIVCEAQETAVGVPAVTDATWKSLIIESDLPVLVEFWAPWCGPCRMIHPVIDELSKEYAGKIKCFKVNTDESPSIATQYGIRSIPTVIIFKGGEKKDAIIGAVPKSTLTASIEKFL